MPFWSDPTIKPKQAFRWVISFGESDYDKQNSRDKEGNFVLSFAAKSVTKPSYTIKSNKYKLLGSHAFNYPTSLEWQPVTIKFVDVWGFGVAKKQNTLKDTSAIMANSSVNIEYPDKDSLYEKSFITEEYVGEPKTQKALSSVQQFFYSYLSDAGYVAPYEGSTPDKLQRFRKSIYKDNSIKAISGDNYESYPIKINELNDSGTIIETWELYNAFISKVSFGDLSYENENLVEITAEIQYDWALLKPFTAPEDDTQYKKLLTEIGTPLARAKKYQDEEIKLTREGIIKSYDGNRQKFYESATARQSLNDGKGSYKEAPVRIERNPEQAIEALKPEIKREDNKAKEERVVKNILASTKAYTELESKPRQGKLSQELSKYYVGTGPLSAIKKATDDLIKKR